MKRILSLVIFFSVAALGASVATPVGQQQADPREGLRAGFRDAGDAAWNMELVINLPKPEGFYDPEQPAGPRRDAEPAGGRGGEGGRGGRGGEGGRGAEGGRGGEGGRGAEGAGGEGEAAEQPETPEPPQLSYTNSDIAFSREFLFQGNYHGFNIYNVEDPREAELFASIVCPGGQGDVSVHGDLLFMSVQETRARLDCGTQGVAEPVSEERFRGVRVFDISDMRAPRQVAAVQTCRGSHTHTLIVDPDDADNVYIYNSGTSGVRPAEELAGCAEDEEAADTALFSIDVIQVPLAAPENARVVSSPRVFSDPETGDVSGLWQGGDHGPGTQSSRETRQCHDITAYPEIGLAAGACSGNGILLDISDPVNPTRVDQVVDPNFAFWHSATFNNDGTKVLFSDEWGGGSRPRCRDIDPPTWGGNAIFDIVGGEMRFRGYYKIPAAQTEQENCVAHNGSLVPVPGRDIMVQGWYQGGLSVFDFTDSAQAVEIAYFDRGPVDDESLISGGYWSAYWYNGFVYGAEIARGLDVFRLTPSEYLSQNEIDAAALATSPETNVQHQQRMTWPHEPVVARAYLDQLGRTAGIADERAGAVNSLLDRADGMSSGGSEAAALAGELDGLATELESDAEEAVYQDVRRLQLLAETLRGIGQALR